jgi:thioredoxin reductase
VAELNARKKERPFAPGSYPVVVVGSGPGGIQLSYSLGRLGVPHALLSSDEGAGGMFRKWPLFQRLLSWTKPYAPPDRGSRAFERYDWNSLVAEEPKNRSLMAEFMDGTSSFPSRPEMERNVAAFADRAGVDVRYGCRWTATRRESGRDGDEFVLETTDGDYRCQAAVFAVGVAEPFVPPSPGSELAVHYAGTRAAETYAGRRVFIIGKQNSGFELASGLLPWARQIVLASPSPVKLSVDTKSLVGVRARYVQPYEDHVLGGGVSVLDAAVERLERTADGAIRVALRRTDGAGDLAFDVDDVIAATGFVAPLLDLPRLGVATVGRTGVPAQTPYWESATTPGIYFAGTITQGAKGLQKHGLPANSGAVHGARYNARVLARHIARTRFGVDPPAPPIDPARLVDRMVEEVTGSPELWHQKAYLAWVASTGDDGAWRDEGIQPLAQVLDAPGPDALILTIEANAAGAIYPVVYLRIGGRMEERAIDPDPFLDFGGPDQRRQFAEAAAGLSSAVRV